MSQKQPPDHLYGHAHEKLEVTQIPAGISKLLRVRQLRKDFPVGTEISFVAPSENGPRDAWLILDYFKGTDGVYKVVLASARSRANSVHAYVRNTDVLGLSRARIVSIFDPADRARLMAYKEAKNQIVSAMHLLRQERRDSPAEPQIPYLKGAEGLRGRLFRSLTPSISPLIQAGCCEMATVKKLVADFFRGIEIKLDANTSVTKTESKRNRHTRFPSAATPNGYIEFEDPLQPESIEGPDGEPIQLVNKIYIQRELFMRVAATDTKPVDPSEVKRWTLKHLNPYPIKVLARTELGTGISQAYPLVDVLYALRYHPLREHILRLNADGFTYVTFGGMKIDVATVEMIAKEGSPVSARAVQAMLKKLDLEHPVAVRVYSHNSNILRTVYRASSLKSMLSLFLQSDGVAIPISGYRTPMRLATTVSALARAEGAENLFAIANKLHVRGIWPVNIAQLGLEVESLDAVGRLGQGYTAMFHLVRVPGLEQSRILMTNHKGSLLVCTGSRIMDLEQIYWKDEVVCACNPAREKTMLESHATSSHPFRSKS